MRLSSTLKQEMCDGITLGYRIPEWLDWEQAERDRWPHSMLREYRDYCIDPPNEEDHWEGVLLSHVNAWAEFVEDRGG